MPLARHTEEDLSRIRQLMEDGQRGRPIGGEILVALGGVLAILCALQGLTAFSFLPLSAAPSPLAAAAAFLAFAVSTAGRNGRHGAALVLLMCVTAALVGELIWRGASYLLLTGGTNGAHVDGGTLGLATGLLGLAVLAGLFAGAALALRRLRRDPAVSSPANRMVTGGWLAVLAAFALVVAICAVSGLRTGLWTGMALVPSLFWALWGLGWWISAQATGRRWMMLVVAGAWIAALWFAYTPDVYLGGAVGFALLAVLPGLKLLRERRRAADEA